MFNAIGFVLFFLYVILLALYQEYAVCIVCVLSGLYAYTVAVVILTARARLLLLAIRSASTDGLY